MRRILNCLLLFFVLLFWSEADSQEFLGYGSAKKIEELWRICAAGANADTGAVFTRLAGAAREAEATSADDVKAYATFFRKIFPFVFHTAANQDVSMEACRKALKQLDEVQKWADQKGYGVLVAACQHFKGWIHYQVGEYATAFSELGQADKAFQRFRYKNIPCASVYLAHVGIILYQLKEYSKALAYLQAASELPSVSPDYDVAIAVTAGHLYSAMNNYKMAGAWYKTAVAKAGTATVLFVLANLNLADHLLEYGRIDSAESMYRAGYEATFNRFPPLAAKAALSLASVFLQQGRPDSAKYYLDRLPQMRPDEKTFPTSLFPQQQLLELQRLNVLVQYSKASGDYKTALLYTDSFSIASKKVENRWSAALVNNAKELFVSGTDQKNLDLPVGNTTRHYFLYFLLFLLLIALVDVAGFGFSRYRKKKKQQLNAAVKENTKLLLAKLQAEKSLEDERERLQKYMQVVKSNTKTIEQLNGELSVLKQSVADIEQRSMTAKLEELTSSTILTHQDWRHFQEMFEQVHPNFLQHLQARFPDLTAGETRLLILTKLNLATQEMAAMLGVSVDAVRKARYRLRKRLNVEKDHRLLALLSDGEG